MMIRKPKGVRQREAWEAKAISMLLDAYPRITTYSAQQITQRAINAAYRAARGGLPTWTDIRRCLLELAAMDTSLVVDRGR